MEFYQEGCKLKENDFLLKIRSDNTGFLTKFNKDETISHSFLNWSKDRPIYVFEETYKSGWKLKNWRFGQSQNWATLIHPEGFTVEIYLKQFLEIVLDNRIENGEIIGEFKWNKNKLYKNYDANKI
jgi:hypothetical protein